MAGTRSIYLSGPESVINDVIKTALMPGVFVKRSSTASDNGQLVVAGANDDDGEVFLLDKQQLKGQGRDEAYVAGTHGRAYRCVDGLRAQVRAPAAAYTVGQAVTVGANGLISTTTSGKSIFGFISDAKTVTAQDVTENDNFVDVAFTNRPAG